MNQIWNSYGDWMNKPRTIEGKWWILGRDQEPQFGVLTFDPEEGITLETKVGGEFTDLKVGSVDDQWGGKTSQRDCGAR